MARINLLPWRAERRKQRQREFYSMLGLAAVVGVVLSMLLYFYYSGQISGQNDRNSYLETEIAKVKEQNKEIERLDRQKEHLLARKTQTDVAADANPAEAAPQQEQVADTATAMVARVASSCEIQGVHDTAHAGQLDDVEIFR